MSDSFEWAESIFTDAELYELSVKSDRILFDNENGFIVNIAITNEQCMDLIENWWALEDPDYHRDIISSFEYIDNFLYDFMTFLQKYLDEEHPEWQELRYNLDDEFDEDEDY